MILLIALRIPAFAFCACDQHVILNNGACCPEQSAAQAQECDCCPSETAARNEPCRDCVIIFSLDPGDFNWSADSSRAKLVEEAPPVLRAGFQDDLRPDLSRVSLHGSIRGSPPLEPFPVLLQIQVLRL
ncbi:MAG: hypothetical protein QF405_02970 [Roseibacillus sp.]|nr:hypothetical protein [Roseibacillus sp.]MDP6207879.1 hypothetical protein [Roseibacillus sp.]MDP7306577.1 hypothetical protein [Roseibacillus sp.]HJM64490.1 hypothetical protein [Roseibacillus sp.]